MLDAGIGIYEDLQTGSVAGVVGAVQKAGTVYNTFKGANLKAVVGEEANQALKGVLRNNIPAAARNTSIVNGQTTQQLLNFPVFNKPPKG